MAVKESQVTTKADIETEAIKQQPYSITSSATTDENVRIYNPNRFQVMFEYSGEMSPLPPKSFSAVIKLSKVKTPLPLQLRIINMNTSGGK